MSNEQIIIIKKIEESGHGGHHGGGWKVAYADFMTAMMAFFLLMWILASSDEEDLRGLADYFTPSLSEAGGRGDGLLAGRVLGPEGVKSGTIGEKSEVQLPSFGQENPLVVFDSRLRDNAPNVVVEYEPSEDALKLGQGKMDSDSGNAASVGAGGRESDSAPEDGTGAGAAETAAENAADQAMANARLEQAKQQRSDALEGLQQEIIRQMQLDIKLAELGANIRFDSAPEGLRVQIVDQKGHPMFTSGSARIQPDTRKLIRIIAAAVRGMPYPIEIAGHTDAVPFANQSGYGNWELSSDRANATRRLMVDAGINPSRISRVSGLADRLLLNPEDPTAPENRRISILLEYPEPTR